MSLYAPGSRKLVFFTAFVAVSLWATLNAQSVSAAERVSPHDAQGACLSCHIATERDLRSDRLSGDGKSQLKSDANGVCLQCHGIDFGHGVGKKPEMNRKGLPLDGDGLIACAITCHDMHVVAAENPHQKAYHLRIPVEDLCFSCHDR
ncbi:cytochrome c3 family protein [Geobacter sulfurreducens]|uniref:cytochrome c3 family protein n=1 Tax=Geobacter sulfurreducens TaxID=35554 RepID=UPI0020B74F8D|nr:cytochrome c3 family protein [Geobacter sulfurreducens]UTG91250.1 cytochrome C [Geobacter sulfurreducens]